MTVMVDTSVWAEYFRRRPRLPPADLNVLDTLIRDDQVVVVQPIRAEILSGRVSKEDETTISRALDALPTVDLDWNSPRTWALIIECAYAARAAGLPPVSIVDRMILLSAETASAALWTLDKALRKLASARGVQLFATPRA